MRDWVLRHRHAIIATYICLMVTVTVVLQVLEIRGELP